MKLIGIGKSITVFKTSHLGQIQPDPFILKSFKLGIGINSGSGGVGGVVGLGRKWADRGDSNTRGARIKQFGAA